ncbi:MAG: hypothetical protein IT452_11210 [Planctomycetia bacterium]|nr:hypothetical protein [Planctomycetia bacterium]
MKLSHLRFLPSAALLVLFCLPWLEVWSWGGCTPAPLATASGLEMVLGTASTGHGGDIGIPKMDEENAAYVLSIAAPRRWAWAIAGLLLPIAIGLALIRRPAGTRLRELQAGSLFLLGGLGAWFCTLASKARCFGFCPDPRQYRGLFPGCWNPFMTMLGVPETSSYGDSYVVARFGLEASFVVYAILATAGVVLVVVLERRRHMVAK